MVVRVRHPVRFRDTTRVSPTRFPSRRRVDSAERPLWSSVFGTPCVCGTPQGCPLRGSPRGVGWTRRSGPCGRPCSAPRAFSGRHKGVPYAVPLAASGGLDPCGRPRSAPRALSGPQGCPLRGSPRGVGWTRRGDPCGRPRSAPRAFSGRHEGVPYAVPLAASGGLVGATLVVARARHPVRFRDHKGVPYAVPLAASGGLVGAALVVARARHPVRFRDTTRVSPTRFPSRRRVDS